MSTKIYYVANARMPTEKAHGIQIAKMCEAFIEASADLTLVVPDRATDPRSLKEFYGLRLDVPIVRLPALNWYNGGRIGYRLASWSFMRSSLAFLRERLRAGERFVLYTVDLDDFSSSHLVRISMPLFSEMHGGKRPIRPMRRLFSRARGIITINGLIRDELRNTFPHSRAEYLVEPNGVDAAAFSPMEKSEARRMLGIPAEERLALYTGRFFDWKGLEIISAAAGEAPEVSWRLVGGTTEEYKALVPGEVPQNIRFEGERPHQEIRAWLSAADVLVVLGTKRDKQSYYYTSPMKLFEYLCVGRPIVASSTPAMKQIVNEREVFFYEPDDARDLAEKVRYTLTHQSERANAARALAKRHSWKERARRILSFIETTI